MVFFIIITKRVYNNKLVRVGREFWSSPKSLEISRDLLDT